MTRKQFAWFVVGILIWTVATNWAWHVVQWMFSDVPVLPMLLIAPMWGVVSAWLYLRWAWPKLDSWQKKRAQTNK